MDLFVASKRPRPPSSKNSVNSAQESSDHIKIYSVHNFQNKEAVIVLLGDLR